MAVVWSLHWLRCITIPGICRECQSKTHYIERVNLALDVTTHDLFLFHGINPGFDQSAGSIIWSCVTVTSSKVKPWQFIVIKFLVWGWTEPVVIMSAALNCHGRLWVSLVWQIQSVSLGSRMDITDRCWRVSPADRFCVMSVCQCGHFVRQAVCVCVWGGGGARLATDSGGKTRIGHWERPTRTDAGSSGRTDDTTGWLNTDWGGPQWVGPWPPLGGPRGCPFVDRFTAGQSDHLETMVQQDIVSLCNHWNTFSSANFQWPVQPKMYQFVIIDRLRCNCCGPAYVNQRLSATLHYSRNRLSTTLQL